MDYEEEQQVPCKLCDAPDGRKGTNLCDGCWEIEHRLDDFLTHQKAREFVLLKVMAYYPRYEFSLPEVDVVKALRATGRNEAADKLEARCPRREFNISGTVTSRFSVSSKSAKPRTEIEAKRERFKKAYGKDMVLDAARAVNLGAKSGHVGMLEKVDNNWDNMVKTFNSPARVCLLDNKQLAAFRDEGFNPYTLPKHTRVNVEGFIVPRAASEAFATAIQVQFKTSQLEKPIDFDTVIERVFDGSKHLVCFEHAKLLWVCENICVVEYGKMHMFNDTAYFEGLKFDMSKYVDHRSMMKKEDDDCVAALREAATPPYHLFKVRRPPPGQPNKNGDVFPVDNVYEVGKPVYVSGNDKPVGVVTEIIHDCITVKVFDDVEHKDKDK